jgi:hypothetical protein
MLSATISSYGTDAVVILIDLLNSESRGLAIRILGKRTSLRDQSGGQKSTKDTWCHLGELTMS